MNRSPFTQVPRAQALEALALVSPSDSRAVPGMNEKPHRTHEPGGDTVRRILHPAFPPLERLNRILPDQSWFSTSVSPTSPVQFELVSFVVPRNMEFWLFDYEFSVFIQSGTDPYDAVKAEDDRFSGVMGFDLQIGINTRIGNLKYQLDPVSAPLQRQAFGGAAAIASKFNSAQFSSFSSIAGVGSSLLPVRSTVQGPRNGVFTYIVGQDQPVVVNCVIFRRLMRPVYCIQGTISGYLVSQNASQQIIERIKPM